MRTGPLGFRVSTAHGAAGLRGPVAYAERLVPGFGLAHQRRLAEIFGHAVGLLALGEWFPNPQTYVDLDPRLRDGNGLPAARITSHLGDNERRLLKRMAFRDLHAHRFWLDVKRLNVRAQSLYASEGFIEEGVLRESVKLADGYDSLVVMSMLSREYDARVALELE